jgi:transposase-like protein
MAAGLKSSLMLEGSGSALEDVTEGARRATIETSSSAPPPDPEVVPIARRRRFPGAEKRRILGEADRCTKPGQLGALLRREGIYSSMLANWRKQRDQADQAALAPRKRGPKPAANREEVRQLKQLARENARLQRELERAHTIIDVQKKICTLLGLPTADESGEDE